MTPKDFQNIDRIFTAAASRASHERDAYLDEACAGNIELRQRIEDLLQQDADPHELLGSHVPAPGPADLEFELQYQIPESIGPYRILNVIGRGGMGVVYRAEQVSPRRIVALKVIRDGMLTSPAMRRFKKEAHLLGQLQHNSIARIYEAATAAEVDGNRMQRPYIAMEFIDGPTLRDYAAHNTLSTRAIATIIMRLCEATEYAHTKGIVHRDLKPTNILMRADDNAVNADAKSAQPHPVILDFGIASMMGNNDFTVTLQTEAGQLIGTLPYMSPEQLEGDLDAVDVRSEVYSIGVMFFELLTGQLPYDIEDKPLASAARILRDEEPIAAATINRHLPGDVNTIVSKALSKDPEMRYHSAAALGADLRRYLNDEPILARRPTTFYQLRKFTRRNRTLVAGIAAVIVVLAAGLASSLILYMRSEDRAESMRRALYAHSIALADNAAKAYDTSLLNQLLLSCPEDLRQWEWRRLRALSDQSDATIVKTSGRIFDVEFSSDDRYVLIASGYDHRVPMQDRETKVRCWDRVQHRIAWSFEPHQNSVGSVAMSRDGTLLATSSLTRVGYGEISEGRLRLWKIPSMEMVWEMDVHPGESDGLAFNHDATTLFVGGGLGEVAAVNVETKEVTWTSGSLGDSPKGIALSEDGSVLVSCNWHQFVHLWNIRTGALIHRFESEPKRALHQVAVRPDAKEIAWASGRAPGTINLESGAQQYELLPSVDDGLVAVAYAGNTHLVAGAREGTLFVYDLANDTMQNGMLGHTAPILNIDASSDGRWIVSASSDGTARLWDMNQHSIDLLLKPHGRSEVNSVAWNRTSDFIITAGDDYAVHKINALTGTIEQSYNHENQYIIAAALSANDELIASVDDHGNVTVWDQSSGERIQRWQAHQNRVWDTEFNPADNSVATASADGTVRIWNPLTTKQLLELDHDGARVNALAFNSTGTKLLACDDNGVVIMWDARNGSMLKKIAHEETAVFAVAWSPDDSSIAIGNDDGKVKLIDARNGNTRLTLNAHSQRCECISFSPDGARLLSGSDDSQVRLFETVQGDHLMTLDDHAFNVYAVEWSPDGKSIASCGADQELRIWRASW